jgi:hypothetical protein
MASIYMDNFIKSKTVGEAASDQVTEQVKEVVDNKVDAKVPPAEIIKTRAIKIKDDFGDEIEYQVDIENEEALRELVAAKHSMTHTKSENELLRAQMEALEKNLGAKTSKLGKLAEAVEMGEDAALEVLLEKHGGFQKYLDQKIKEREDYAKLSQKERDSLDIAAREQALRDQQDKFRKELDAREKSIKEKEAGAAAETEVALYRSSASKYCPLVAETDPAFKVHQLIFNEAKGELNKLKSSGVRLTGAIIEQKFKQAYASNKSLVDAVKPKGQSGSNKLAEDTKRALEGSATNTGNQSAATSSETLEAHWGELVKNGKTATILKELREHPERREQFDAFFHKITKGKTIK